MIKLINTFFSKGHQRTILAKKNILFSFFIKLVGIFIVFTMVSLSIKYLGKENYGVWIVLSGLIAWTNVFDLGFSHGLRNRLAEARANENLENGKYYVSTTYAFLILIAIVLLIIFFPLFMYLDWQNILNTTAIDNGTIRTAVFIIFSFFILQFILKPIGSILEAFQLPAISQFISLVGSALALIGVFYLFLTDKPSSLFSYAYIVAGMPLIAFLVASIYFYRQKFSELIPSIKYIKKTYFKKIAGLGLSFFIIQLTVIIIFQSDNMMISYLFGPEEVTNYNIVYRYFSIIITIVGVIMVPFWTAFTDAYQKNDLEWIQKTIQVLLSIVGGSALGGIIFFLIANDIYHLWIDETINIPSLLSGLMAVYAVLFGLINVFAFFLNGIGKVKIQLIINSLAAIINIPLSYLLAYIFGMGVSGVLLSTIICMLLIGTVSALQYYKIIQNKAYGVWNA